MKLSINLATLAFSTLVTAYCVQPALQPTISEEQEVIKKSHKIPGHNFLEYCNDNPDDNLLKLESVDIDPIMPVIDGSVNVNIKGFTPVPITDEIFIRILDWKTRQDLITPVELLSLLRKSFIETPIVGNFQECLGFRPHLSKLLMT
ncbi:CSEP0392 putative effector protein [Blumeria hordei DH14]|uniref:CSEP0392 putative effector protein n=1 Tax=Blumeria graminis f. sp. hordei (strain DH14) TaxID=546991 RepID=N1JAM2_BLUG1|nr:CSEP0392 putative effector protein [Blumeria hordei DH14]